VTTIGPPAAGARGLFTQAGATASTRRVCGATWARKHWRLRRARAGGSAAEVRAESTTMGNPRRVGSWRMRAIKLEPVHACISSAVTTASKRRSPKISTHPSRPLRRPSGSHRRRASARRLSRAMRESSTMRMRGCPRRGPGAAVRGGPKAASASAAQVEHQLRLAGSEAVTPA